MLAEQLPQQQERLNDALLVDEKPKPDEEPKRNSKDDLVAKIITVCAENQLELEHSNTKLKRMTKQQLCKILAEKIEDGVRCQMAAQVGAKPGASDTVIALGALKMMHNLLATKGTEHCAARLRVRGRRVLRELERP